MKQPNHFVAVEANIAAGKSTLLPKLAAELGWEAIQEPVNDPEFTRLLQDFTDHPQDSSKRILFQEYITDRRADIVKKLPTDRNYLIERSLYSDLIFTQANFLSMDAPDERYMLHYCAIQNRLKDYPVISAVVYLRTAPEVSHSRLINRARAAEDGTPLSYLRDIHNYHEAILPQICRSMNTPLITVEWDDFGCERKVANALLQIISKEKQ
ncbi:deoxynucleoside kinase [Endozoicomonas ascidiicola]|uniref:deoxynucleoside kinase n=1 Tax=Endozoicomonas ascidiicola TaxID=1698521 RepID=UPI000833499C|nr:deoxynucleoside kinase [Endozoicomonas ascidiicola]